MGFYRRFLSILLMVMLLLCCTDSMVQQAFCIKHVNVYAYSADKILTVSQAKNLALKNSRDYKSVKSDITLLQVKYEQAVKSIALKKHNMTTFRWTPLLSFKFPEKADLTEEYEFTYKPLQIQSDITAKKHKLSDIVYEIYEETELVFVKLYVYQEKIAFNRKRIETLKEDISRNKARVLTGDGVQDDVDKMQSSLDKLESDTAAVMRSFENAKEDLSDLIKIDVSTGYRFASPLVTAEIERNRLNGLIQRTLDMDQEYYEAKLAAGLALTSLNTYESLMKKQYGGNMSYIQSYVNMAKSNQEIDYDAFKSAYDAMQIAVDNPWAGNIKILFIKIPKEWFRGQISGIRYIEDEPYALLTAAKEYMAAVNEQESVQKAKEKAVKSGFENIVTARNAYLSLENTVNKLKKDYQKLSAKNKLGEAGYDEVREVQAEYEETQMDMLESLAAYAELLYSYDRLTCGGITALLSGADISGDSVEGGDSIVIKEGDEGAWYTIQSKVEDNLFLFSVSVPEGFEPDVNFYELWVNGIQIGERTGISSAVRHLALDLENVESAFVRFYSGEDFVDDCEIDASVYHGKLNISGGYAVKPRTEIIVGTYECKDSGSGTAELGIKPELAGAAYYRLVTTEEQAVLSDALIPISDKFRYLSVLKDSFQDMRIYLYDEEKQLLCKGEFETGTLQIKMVQPSE